MAEKAKAVQPHATLTDALIAAQAGFDAVRKQATNPHFKSKYADLSTVVDAVLPHLNANGILLTQPVLSTPDGLMLRTLLRHTSGQELACEVPLPTPANWQQWGSALTYCRRYSIMALLGVAPEDDDGNDAEGVQPRPPVHKPRGEATDASRKTELAKRAQNAPSPSEPPASEPVATTATGRNEFLDDLDREMDRALAKDATGEPKNEEPPLDLQDGPPLETDPDKLVARCKMLAKALCDHRGDIENLKASYDLYEDEINGMPKKYRDRFKQIFDEQMAEIERIES